MPTLRQDNALNEYNFTTQEVIAGDLLTLIQIQRLQTRFAQLLKEKASSILPGKIEDERAFILNIAELDGKMNMIQELFQNHIEAQKMMNDPELAAEFAIKGTPGVEEILSQQRASSSVHDPNQS